MCAQLQKGHLGAEGSKLSIHPAWNGYLALFVPGEGKDPEEPLLVQIGK